MRTLVLLVTIGGLGLSCPTCSQARAKMRSCSPLLARMLAHTARYLQSAQRTIS